MKTMYKPTLELNDKDIERIATIQREFKALEEDLYNATQTCTEDADLYEMWAEAAEWVEMLDDFFDKLLNGNTKNEMED